MWFIYTLCGRKFNNQHNFDIHRQILVLFHILQHNNPTHFPMITAITYRDGSVDDSDDGDAVSEDNGDGMGADSKKESGSPFIETDVFIYLMICIWTVILIICIWIVLYIRCTKNKTFKENVKAMDNANDRTIQQMNSDKKDQKHEANNMQINMNVNIDGNMDENMVSDFEGNLSSLHVANDILMDDVLGDMDVQQNGDIIIGNTPGNFGRPQFEQVGSMSYGAYIAFSAVLMKFLFLLMNLT